MSVTMTGSAVPKQKRTKKSKKSKSAAPLTEEPTLAGVADSDGKLSTESPSLKRKRDNVAEGEEELEIDLSLPEPPSKKALRKAKQGKISTSDATAAESAAAQPTGDETKAVKRSDYGIWIGNLPWTLTKPALRIFLLTHSKIDDAQITRIHMPAPDKKAGAERKFHKPQNKGFAYVDLDTAESLKAVIGISETLFEGRRVLIKDAKSFVGRPDKPAAEPGQSQSGDGKPSTADGQKPPSKRVFVGNLAFDVTKEDLTEHYQQCGEIVDIHMATFQDSGKCKGFAWVTFAELEAGETAVRGWVMKPVEEDGSSSEDDNERENEETSKKKKGKKTRKWFVNKHKGRPLRCEFAEDAVSRYKKRFKSEGKGRPASSEVANGDGIAEVEAAADDAQDKPRKSRGTYDKKARSEYKVDARTIRPGAALANAQRSTAAIVEGTGKKTTFD